MTKDIMPKPDTGVHRRERSTAWQWRIKVPKDLLSEYPSEWAHRTSLNTADLREANTKAAQLRAQWLARFKEQRRERNAQPVAVIGPELGPTLAARIRAEMLRADEGRRQAGTVLTEFLDWVRVTNRPRLTIRPPDVDSQERSWFYGLTPEQLRGLSELHAIADGRAAVDMAARNYGAVVAMADAEARKLGLIVDWRKPEARPVLHECLKAYREAWKDIRQRDSGEDIETPTAPSKAPTAAPVTLRQVFERWKGVKVRSVDSVKTCARALSLFEQQSGGTPLQDITRAQGDAFRAWLQTQGTSSKTASDRLTWVKSLLKYAHQDLELIPRHPWKGIDIKSRTENPRRPWTDDHMVALFEQSIYTRYEVPKDPKAGGAAAYWVPLLALFTGARVGELCQLRVADVEGDKDGTWIRITNEAEGSRVKTEAGHRMVPLHSELARLGFLDYVEALRTAGATSLRPGYRFRANKPGGYFSDWFGQERRKNDPPRWPDLHSLRHTVRTALVEAGIEGDVIDRVVGHEASGSTGNRRYTHPRAILRRAVEALHFPPTRQLSRPHGSSSTPR